jgi:transposase
VLTGVLGYSKVSAGALVFSKSAPDLLWAMERCLRRFGGVPRTHVFDREGALCADETAPRPRPTEPLARFAGHFGFGVHFRPGGDPEGKGVIEPLHGYMETSFVPGRRFSDPEDFRVQLDRWFEEVANVRLHRTIRCRPVDRLAEDRSRMLELPERSPDLT